VRITKSTRSFESGSGRAGNLPSGKNGPKLQGGGETVDVRRGPTVTTQTIAWQPSCECGTNPIPQTILDPFAGAGTTLEVALRLGRDYIGIELNEGYVKDLIRPRLIQLQL